MNPGHGRAACAQRGALLGDGGRDLLTIQNTIPRPCSFNPRRAI